MLHRRIACQNAFKLLVTRNSPTKLSFKHFSGLISYYKPHASKLEIYLMFKALDSENQGFLTRENFYKVYETANLKWIKKEDDSTWYSDFNIQISNFFRIIHRCVKHESFEIFTHVLIAMSFLWQIFEASTTSTNFMQQFETSLVTLTFVSCMKN